MIKDNNLFAPRAFGVRLPTDNRKKHGAILNPPRLAELGGLNTHNADKAEPTLKIKKPGGTR